jgi:hypothetical protein
MGNPTENVVTAPPNSTIVSLTRLKGTYPPTDPIDKYIFSPSLRHNPQCYTGRDTDYLREVGVLAIRMGYAPTHDEFRGRVGQGSSPPTREESVDLDETDNQPDGLYGNQRKRTRVDSSPESRCSHPGEFRRD